MAKRVFFSFHYDDVKTFRANVVRNHGLTKPSAQEAGFFDSSIWEDARRRGDASVKRLVNAGLENTSVTCALIGSQTWSRRWVRYELLKSYDRGNQLLGVHINGVTDKNRQTFSQGLNPFDYLGFHIATYGRITYYEHDGTRWIPYLDLPTATVTADRKFWGKGYSLSDWVPCYDWARDDGYSNFRVWAENAK
jgi:hypothetical protein